MYWKSDPALGPQSVERSEHPLDQVLGLVHYLLLTCFEILGGRSEEWLDFGAWLRAGRCKSEREAVGPLSSDGVEAASQLLAHYNGLYGARQGFIWFIKEGMTPEQRTKVLASVELGGSQTNSADRDKIKRLYEIRNNFTHEGLAAGSVVARLRGHGIVVPDLLIEERDGAWTLSEVPLAIGSKDDGTGTHVKLWPHVLFDVLSQHIDETILPDTPIQIRVIGATGEQATYVMHYRNYAELTALDQRALAELAGSKLRQTSPSS